MGTFDERRIFEEWVAVHGRDCPSRTVIEVLANKWALYVLGAIRRYERPMRFSELRRLLDGITQKMLTQTLRALERDGLIRRDVYPTVPPRVEYGLTPLGVDVGKLTNAVAEWAVENVDQIFAARSAFDDKAAEAAQPL
ncbi:winged helix-turn-helix transcriptional regulator [Amycolatopsis umgeniensis]|uniref:DNA-binding HxlR family transcriptional regulator n=1 Tax=Amycolatopsis umgeniensis TaxID=336628 RepID=A0A841B3C8_9PSEU|nr:helix-turn-helix domain-containing protein [Amycolatopsis umgeniensis]MBB5852888.1 DNA-binding HxlR family transcriptional regulator [Amycolatopsis umgeniensis]